MVVEVAFRNVQLSSKNVAGFCMQYRVFEEGNEHTILIQQKKRFRVSNGQFEPETFIVPLPGSLDFTSIEADFQFTSDSGSVVYE